MKSKQKKRIENSMQVENNMIILCSTGSHDRSRFVCVDTIFIEDTG